MAVVFKSNLKAEPETKHYNTMHTRHSQESDLCQAKRLRAGLSFFEKKDHALLLALGIG